MASLTVSTKVAPPSNALRGRNEVFRVGYSWMKKTDGHLPGQSVSTMQTGR